MNPTTNLTELLAPAALPAFPGYTWALDENPSGQVLRLLSEEQAVAILSFHPRGIVFSFEENEIKHEREDLASMASVWISSLAPQTLADVLAPVLAGVVARVAPPSLHVCADQSLLAAFESQGYRAALLARSNLDPQGGSDLPGDHTPIFSLILTRDPVAAAARFGDWHAALGPIHPEWVRSVAPLFVDTPGSSGVVAAYALRQAHDSLEALRLRRWRELIWNWGNLEEYSAQLSLLVSPATPGGVRAATLWQAALRELISTLRGPGKIADLPSAVARAAQIERLMGENLTRLLKDQPRRDALRFTQYASLVMGGRLNHS